MAIVVVIEDDEQGANGPIFATSDPAVIKAVLIALDRRIFAGTSSDPHQHTPLVTE